MELRLCTVAGLFCSPIHNIAPHISLHDLPYHTTISEILESNVAEQENFYVAPAESLHSDISLFFHNIFARVAFSLSTTQIDMVNE